jgi:hypothetical protein
MGVSGQRHAPVKGPPVPTVQKAGWDPEPIWTYRLQKKSLRLCQGSNLDRPVVQPMARQGLYYRDLVSTLLIVKMVYTMYIFA